MIEKPNSMFKTGQPGIRILLLDRHTLFRAGLRLLIQKQPGVEIVGEAGGLREGLALIRQFQPDLILMDLNLDGRCEIEILPDILEAWGEARVILLTGIEDQQVLLSAVQNGAMGIVLKEHSPDTLLKAIEKVYAGEVWIDRSMMADVLIKISRPTSGIQPGGEAGKISLLSPREREVIRMVGLGLKNRQIADRLFISETTVRHHLTSIFSKLEVTDRLELLIYAYQNRLAELPR